MKESALTKLREGANALGIALSDQQVQQFGAYGDFLLEYNEKVNLTAITDEDEVAVKHFVDSLTATKLYPFKGNEKAIDVGTGAGFPAIPLLIIYPTLNMTLLDSLQKRLVFLEEVLRRLGLKAALVHGRAEDVGHQPAHRERYDLVLSRAVAQLNILAEFCLPLARVGGAFLALKGPNLENELHEGQKALTLLGGKIDNVVEMELPLSDEGRNLVVVKKVKPTPGTYPRKAGTPKKSPLA